MSVPVGERQYRAFPPGDQGVVGSWLLDRGTAARRAEILALAFDKIRQGLCVFDGEQRLLLFNRQYAEMYGLSPDDLWLGMTLRDVIDLRYAAGTGPNMSREDYAIWRDGIAVADQIVESVVELRHGAIHEIHHEPTSDGGWVATFDDITERRRTEKLLRHMARHDPLTDLPNRQEFRERLETALERREQYGGLVGVLCLDLDRFKAVNDTHGHGVGDDLLCSVADRIRRLLSGSETAARLGGDEFAILLPDVAEPGAVPRLAEHLGRVIGRTYVVQGHFLDVGASVGAALAPLDGSDPETLGKHADLALYGAKRNRTGRALAR